MIKLVVLDVDGTMTDGKIIYSNSGDEVKNFDVKDGLAIAYWTKRLGRKAAIITGRKSKLVEKRANELGINYLYQGVDDKDRKLEEILKLENINWNEVASIGDDLNDYKMLKKSAISFVPNNASKYVKEIANVVCEHNGGDGAVREMFEYIIKEEGLEEEFIKAWQ